MANKKGNLIPYAMLIFSSVIWGFQPVCIKWLLEAWNPVTITTVRYFLISLILFVILYRRQGRQIFPHKEDIKWFVLMGLFGIFLNNVLQFSGLKETTVVNCTLISATSPAITAFFAFFIIRERLSLFSWIGIAVSFAGVLTVVSDGSWEVIRQIDFHVGDVLCFLSQISWAFYSFAALNVMRRVSVGVTTLWAGFCGAIFTLVYGLIVGEFQVSLLPPLPLLSFAYMAILGGLLSIFFYNYAMNETGPSLASIFLNIMPVVGMFSGFLVLSESIDVVQIAGALTIFIGVYWTTHGDIIADRLLHRN
jgi:drug/metabolite transporter (DMT)-like permease